MPRKRLKLPLVPVKFFCFNCDKLLTVTKQPKLYCSEKCQQKASFVRYYRSCGNDGRINQVDVSKALKIRIVHILNGGYKENKRRLPSSVRLAVFKRDNRTCQKCGQPGNEIDHIDGDSNNLENLQVLCHDCHTEKTISSFKKLTTEIEGYDEKTAVVENLRSRTESKKTKRICDDEKNWNVNRKIIVSDMRRVIYNERFLAFSRNEGIDTTNIEQKLSDTNLSRKIRLKITV